MRFKLRDTYENYALNLILSVTCCELIEKMLVFHKVDLHIILKPNVKNYVVRLVGMEHFNSIAKTYLYFMQLYLFYKNVCCYN